MFESITISIQNKNEPNNPLDIGCLIECMLFYDKVNVVANQAVLKQLLSYFGCDRLIELMDEELLNILYTDSFVGVMTDRKNNFSYHNIIEYSLPHHGYFDQINNVCTEITGKVGKGRRIANRIRDKIQLVKNDIKILEGTRESILDQVYIKNAVKVIINELVPENRSKKEFKFETSKSSEGIVVETDLNFDQLNLIYHKRIPPSHSSLNVPYIFAHLLDSEKDLYFSSTNLSEIASSELSSKIIEQKINYLLFRSKKSKETLSNFSSFVFNDYHSIREAVNSNKIELNELIPVLKHSKKFKDWLKGIPIDENLLKHYYVEVTRKSFVDRLPGKSTRWLLFTGAGLITDILVTGGIATVSGLGLSVLDSFFIDKIITGWKPSHFIEEEVKSTLLGNTNKKGLV